MLQEFDLHIIDRNGAENPIANNLSRLENVLDDPLPIDDSFPNEQLVVINASRNTPWYADYENYIFSKFIPPSFTYQQKKKFFLDLRHHFVDDPHLYKGVYGVIRRRVLEHEQEQILVSVTLRHTEDTMLETEPHIRYYNLLFIGLPFLRMQVSLSSVVINVKELVILVDVRKCL